MRLDEAITEAVGFYDGVEEAMPEAFRVLVAVGRDLANGERVEWCVQHDQAARPKAPTCIMVAYLEAVRAIVAESCRIVSKLLIDYPTEEE